MTKKEWYRICFLFFVFLVFIFVSLIMENRISKVEIQLESLKSQLESANNSNDKLFAELTQLRLEFDSYKQLTSDEFESTWDSFGAIRNNFISLGHGFHLEEKDITPAQEMKTED